MMNVEDDVIDLISVYSYVDVEDIKLSDKLNFIGIYEEEIQDIILDILDNYDHEGEYDDSGISEEVIDSWNRVEDIVSFVDDLVNKKQQGDERMKELVKNYLVDYARKPVFISSVVVDEKTKRKTITLKETKGNPVAMFVSVLHVPSNSYLIGWSKCDTQDHFSKLQGRQLAMGRIKNILDLLNSGEDKSVIKEKFFNELPPDLKDDLKRFSARCKKYYKDCTPYFEYDSSSI
jgi:hypothetical protein